MLRPLSEHTRKDQHFYYEKDQQLTFEELKQQFTTAPILAHFDFDRDVIVETNASDYHSAGVLSQYSGNGILHPVAFFTTKHNPAECNYEIYNKELVACYTSRINTHEGTDKATAVALLRSLPHNSTQLYGNTIEYVISCTFYYPVHKCDA